MQQNFKEEINLDSLETVRYKQKIYFLCTWDVSHLWHSTRHLRENLLEWKFAEFMI